MATKIERVSFEPWTCPAWRFHSRRYEAISPAGALRVTGRFHRGLDEFADDEVFPAIYLSLAPHIALSERLRHTTAKTLVKLQSQRLSRIRVRLQAVAVVAEPPEFL